MAEKFPINRTYHTMMIERCPYTKAKDHLVFLCLSNCNHFEGIHDNCVICNYEP